MSVLEIFVTRRDLQSITFGTPTGDLEYSVQILLRGPLMLRKNESWDAFAPSTVK